MLQLADSGPFRNTKLKVTNALESRKAIASLLEKYRNANARIVSLETHRKISEMQADWIIQVHVKHVVPDG